MTFVSWDIVLWGACHVNPNGHQGNRRKSATKEILDSQRWKTKPGITFYLNLPKHLYTPNGKNCYEKGKCSNASNEMPSCQCKMTRKETTLKDAIISL